MNRKLALVTGASSGIGKAIVMLLAQNGIHVIINYSKSDDEARAVQNEITKQGGTADIIKADVSSESHVKEMFKKIDEQYHKLDYLVNNAGIDDPMPMEEYEMSRWMRVIQVNLVGKFMCIQNAIPLLKKSTDGRIVNIASRLGTKPLEELSAYCASEAAILMLTKVSALELAKYNIMVNTVSPGFTETPMNLRIVPKEQFSEFWQNSAKNNPRGRVGQPDDIARVVKFILLDNTYVNGEEIQVTGGSVLK